MTTSLVHFSELQKGVGVLEISRPEALNALNTGVLRQLSEHVHMLTRNPSLSVVILKSSGDKAFVAGADIKEMLDFSPAQAFEFSRFGQAVFNSLNQLPQVVIAQVQGFALGGGLELALAADFIIASQKAKFGLPEVGLGLIPGFGGTQRLVKRLGLARALEWTASAEKYNAQAAYELGLVNRVVEPEQLANTVESLAATIAAQGPQAVRAAKRAACAADSAAGDLGFEFEGQLFAACFSGVESKEGLSAFVEKRKPDFRAAVR
jgi:enoyl-CoA hydratase